MFHSYVSYVCIALSQSYSIHYQRRRQWVTIVNIPVYSDIVAQTLASLIFLCWACTHVAGAFQPIRADIAVSDYYSIYSSRKLLSFTTLLLSCVWFYFTKKNESWILNGSCIQNGRRKWDDVGSCLSFATFEHRAKALSPTYAFDSGRSLSVSLFF